MLFCQISRLRLRPLSTYITENRIRHASGPVRSPIPIKKSNYHFLSFFRFAFFFLLLFLWWDVALAQVRHEHVDVGEGLLTNGTLLHVRDYFFRGLKTIKVISTLDAAKKGCGENVSEPRSETLLRSTFHVSYIVQGNEVSELESELERGFRPHYIKPRSRALKPRSMFHVPVRYILDWAWIGNI